MVDFKNNIHAFEDKSNTDLFRAWILFKTISNPIISKILTKLLQIALLFRLPITFLIKISIFKHFCGGENIEECKKTIDKLWDSRIGSILDYSAEGKESENDFKQVYEQGMKILETSKNNEKIPFIVFKFTGLIPFKILNKISNKQELNSYEQKTYDLFINRINLICKKAIKIMKPIQKGDVPNTYADIKDIQADYNFTPKTKLAEGIPMFIEWFKSYHNLN